MKKTLYTFDKDNLVYTEYVKDDSKLDYSTVINIIILLIVLATIFIKYPILQDNRNHEYPIDQSCEPLVEIYSVIGSQAWKDSIFNDYERRAEIYLSRFTESPMKASMLRLAAYNAYDSTGVLLPLELALSQAQIESSMGTKGRSPKNNPYNVGEYDNGTVLYFENTFDGIQAYYYLMCINYLQCKSLDELLINFTNCNDYRYASNKNYEKEISKQYNFIESNINSKLLEDITV